MPSALQAFDEVVRDAGAVGLAVVQDVDALDALLLQERRVGRALEVVRHRDACVVALARREVLAGLARHPCRLGEPHVRVGRADHRDGAAWSAVENRGDDLCATGVERADQAQEVLDRLVAVGVVGARLRIPRALGGRGVVARGVRDRLVADLELHLLELEADGRDDLHGERTQRALQGQVAGDDVLAVAERLDRCSAGLRAGLPRSSARRWLPSRSMRRARRARARP